MAELGRSLIMVPEKERMERKDMKERWRDERKMGEKTTKTSKA